MVAGPRLTLRERRLLRANVLDELIRLDETIAALDEGIADIDGATAADTSLDLTEQRALVAGLLVQAQQDRAEMRATQDRIELDDYGMCRTCHRFIGVDRLLAVPSAESCVDCAR